MRQFLSASAVILGLLAGVSPLAPAGQPVAAEWTPAFYPFCVELGVPGVKPRSLADQVQLFRQLGFDGAGDELWLDDQLEKNLQTFDQAGLKVYLLYTSINLARPDRPYDPRVPAAIARLKGRPVTVCVLLVGLPAGDPKGMEPATKILRQLGDVAAKAGVRISIYNHVGNWTESLPFTLEVVKKTDHPNVGANFNLCHYLKVDGQKDYRPLLREHAARIFAVTICGAQVGSQTWTNGLIQPLDLGNFDNRQLLTVLRESAYRGPIGLMCYGVPGDAREHLARSIKVWKTWRPKD
jgi:sugar phosphate isomerase/epimerase